MKVIFFFSFLKQSLNKHLLYFIFLLIDAQKKPGRYGLGGSSQEFVTYLWGRKNTWRHRLHFCLYKYMSLCVNSSWFLKLGNMCSNGYRSCLIQRSLKIIRMTTLLLWSSHLLASSRENVGRWWVWLWLWWWWWWFQGCTYPQPIDLYSVHKCSFL